jgi:hypothetical protein
MAKPISQPIPAKAMVEDVVLPSKPKLSTKETFTNKYRWKRVLLNKIDGNQVVNMSTGRGNDK